MSASMTDISGGHVRRYVVLSVAFAMTVLGILLAVLNGLHIAPAHAVHTDHIHYKSGDQFRVYDCINRSVQNVDWPTGLIFSNCGGGVTQAKDRLQRIGFTSIAPAHYTDYRLSDGSGGQQYWQWDNDEGRKTPDLWDDGANYDNIHVRVYADSDGEMYNATWGCYCLGTTHLDHNELLPGSYFGFNEWCEQVIHQWWSNRYGSGNAYYDLENFENPDTTTSGNHYWNNDGWATKLRVVAP